MVKNIKARFIDGNLEPLEHLNLHEGQEVLISVEETPAPKKRTGKRDKSFGADSLLKLAGIGEGEEATDVSQNIHKYIADAYASHFTTSTSPNTDSPR
jgi:predicted DNA-binding antitoxin AbrB/MazE fold protein